MHPLRSLGLSAKLQTLVAVALVVIGVSAAISFITASKLAAENARMQEFSVALRASATADMAHDALRADVLAAFVDMPGETENPHDAVVESGESLKTDLQATRLTSEIETSVDAVMPDVDRYIQLGSEITQLATTDRRAAQQQLPAFSEQFSKLEVSLEANSDVVQDASAKQKEHAHDVARAAQVVIIGLALISAALFASVARLLVRSVVRGVDAERNTVAEASTSLVDINRTVGSNVQNVEVQTTQLVAGADQVNANVSTLASAVDQMSASISEIAGSAGQAANIAEEGMNTVSRTTDVVGQLGVSSSEIGKVLDVITSIAEQTNLLALNATIEAARAGDAGKGFAVVANEVKELAKETAHATDEIGQRIGAIQSDTESAVNAIEDIARVMSKISDFQNTIASAVEEQTATTTEIANNLGDVARLTEMSMTGIAHVAAAARQAATTVSEGERIAMSLAHGDTRVTSSV